MRLFRINTLLYYQVIALFILGFIIYLSETILVNAKSLTEDYSGHEPSTKIDTITFNFPFVDNFGFQPAEENTSYSQNGNKLVYDSMYFYLNHSPLFIHSGEMHYFRIPEAQWEDYIIRARNGGINCISTCVYWGIHEPRNNIWNFTGRYDISRFIELCRKHGMFVILRIGPVINAETRNGGIPQWLREKLPGRYNNELYPSPEWYMKEVKEYYQKLALEVNDHFPSQGGNVIMVQIDNETNCSWVWGRKETQEEAQRTADQYLEFAKEAGFEGPFSGTYWEPGYTVRPKGTLPVTGAYPIKAWSYDKYPEILHLPVNKASGHYHGFSPEVHKYPVFCAENQGGAGYYTVTPADFPEGYNIIDIAGGVKGTNYYMYAGGTNPQRYPGPYFDQYTGKSIVHPDVTKMSYDLMSPLGAFQETRDTYHYIRRLGFFIESYGGSLEKSNYLECTENSSVLGKPKQAGFLQIDNGGFVFVNSYVLPNDHQTSQLKINLLSNGQDFYFPVYSELIYYRNKPLILPVNLNIDGIIFNYSTANLFNRFNNKAGKHLVFYSNGNNVAEYHIRDIEKKQIAFFNGVKMIEVDSGITFIVNPANKNNLIVLQREGEKPVFIKTFTEEQSLKAYKLPDMDSCMILTDLIPLDVKNGVLRYEHNDNNAKKEIISFYPGIDFSSNDGYENQWSEIAVQLDYPKMIMDYSSEVPGEYVIQLNNSSIPENVKEVYLKTTRIGYSQGVEMTVDGMLVADSYFRFSSDGVLSDWSFGLKGFLESNSLQWVLEKQSSGNDIAIFNKLSGKLLSSSGDSLSTIDFDDHMKNNYLWETISMKDGNFKIRNKQNSLYLESDGERVYLNGESDSDFQCWKIMHTSEFYSSLKNVGGNKYLDLNGEQLLLNTESTDITVKITSYSFTKSMEKFSMEYEYGDYVLPHSWSFLMQGHVNLTKSLTEN